MIDTQERARPVHPWVMEGQRNIRFSVTLWPDPAWRTLVDTVQQAEALGFDAYMTYDHPSGGSPDCWTALAALAARTTRIRLGPEVNCVYYRNPVMLARLAADIDRISDGRLISVWASGGPNRNSLSLARHFHRCGSASGHWRIPSRSCTASGVMHRLPTRAASSACMKCGSRMDRYSSHMYRS